MKNLKRGTALMLAVGFAFSISTPVFATDIAENEETSTIVTPEVKEKKPLKAASNAVIAKTGLSFEIGTYSSPKAFVTINDNTNHPTFAFKNGYPNTTAAGNYSTVIVVNFDDGTSIELTANYTVNEAPPLATLKSTTPIIAQDSKPTPNQFVTAGDFVSLSFKYGAPSTKKTGTYTTTILATKNGVAEDLVVTFSVTDQTPPTIICKEILPVIKKGGTLDYNRLVDITDNSGKYKVSYKPGHEADTSTLGYHEAIIIATDAAGNTQEATIPYKIVANGPTLKTPKINTTTSTASTVYGTTSPNVTVEMLDADGNTIDSTYSDEKGNFTLKLKNPLKLDDEFSLIAYSPSSFTYSQVASYSYNEFKNTIRKMPAIVKKTETKPANTKEKSAKDTLPKTGDESSFPLAVTGLLLSSSAVIVLRKK